MGLELTTCVQIQFVLTLLLQESQRAKLTVVMSDNRQATDLLLGRTKELKIKKMFQELIDMYWLVSAPLHVFNRCHTFTNDIFSS